MKRAIAIGIVLLMCLSLCACNSVKKNIVGMWISDKKARIGTEWCADYWVFNSDGTFDGAIVSLSNYRVVGTMSGTYTVKGNTVLCAVTEFDDEVISHEATFTYKSSEKVLIIDSTGNSYSKYEE